MSDDNRVSTRLKDEEDKKALEEVKKVFELKGDYGEDSKAIRRALRFTAENHGRPIRKFMAEFGSQERAMIKEKIEAGEL